MNFYLHTQRMSQIAVTKWDREGGREAQEGGDMGIYVWLIHFVVQQKLTQYCEAIILQ